MGKICAFSVHSLSKSDMLCDTTEERSGPGERLCVLSQAQGSRLQFPNSGLLWICIVRKINTTFLGRPGDRTRYLVSRNRIFCHWTNCDSSVLSITRADTWWLDTMAVCTLALFNDLKLVRNSVDDSEMAVAWCAVRDTSMCRRLALSRSECSNEAGRVRSSLDSSPLALLRAGSPSCRDWACAIPHQRSQHSHTPRLPDLSNSSLTTPSKLIEIKEW